MATIFYTREKQIQKSLKELQRNWQEEQNQIKQESINKQLEEDFKTIDLPRNLQKQILENIWYKLYMLQHYNISMDMFKGSNIRWTTILTYLTYIRAIYKGYKYKDPFPKSLYNYVQGLMDSGTEPYSTPEGKRIKQISINNLLKQNILTKQQIDFIFSSVGVTEEDPDTSSAWTQRFCERELGNSHNMDFYTNIVKKDEYISNPINTNVNFSKEKCGFKSLFKID